MRRRSPCRAAVPDRSLRSGTDVVLGFEAADPRSDDGRRRVEIRQAGISLDRRVAGVHMRVAVPFGLFEGVALSVRRRGHGGIFVQVRLAHADPDMDIVLFEATDDRDVVAEWQYWADRCALPMLVAEEDGSLSKPFRHCGALRVEDPRARRMPANLAWRRPRFLARRRAATLAADAVVHREREIIARD